MKSKKIYTKVTLICSSLIFFLCLSAIFYFCFVEPYLLNKKAQQAKVLYSNSAAAQVEVISDPFSELVEINPDVKGWIKIDNTVIDYPVLQSSKEEPLFYLDHNYLKEYFRSGSIFMDSKCNFDDTNSKNFILHGHNMNAGTMFNNILKFCDLNFYKSTPIIQFDTIRGKAKWKIISVFRSNTKPEQGEVFNFLQTHFNNTEEFLEFVYKIKVRSLLEIPVDICANDTLLMLSTCSYEMKDFRTVVVARKIRENESEAVEIEKAKENSAPVLPKGYYKILGTKQPNLPKTFKEALAENKINWFKQ